MMITPSVLCASDIPRPTPSNGASHGQDEGDARGAGDGGGGLGDAGRRHGGIDIHPAPPSPSFTSSSPSSSIADAPPSTSSISPSTGHGVDHSAPTPPQQPLIANACQPISDSWMLEAGSGIPGHNGIVTSRGAGPTSAAPPAPPAVRHPARTPLDNDYDNEDPSTPASALSSFFRNLPIPGNNGSRMRGYSVGSQRSERSSQQQIPDNEQQAPSTTRSEEDGLAARTDYIGLSSTDDDLQQLGQPGGTGPPTSFLPLTGSAPTRKGSSNAAASVASARRLRKLSGPIQTSSLRRDSGGSYYKGSSVSNNNNNNNPTSPNTPRAGGEADQRTSTATSDGMLSTPTRSTDLYRNVATTSPSSSSSSSPYNNPSALAAVANGAGAMLSGSISFLSNLASFDRLPSVFGLGGGAGSDAFPRWDDGTLHGENTIGRGSSSLGGGGDASEATSTDLRLEDATADGETFQDATSPTVSETNNNTPRAHAKHIRSPQAAGPSSPVEALVSASTSLGGPGGFQGRSPLRYMSEDGASNSEASEAGGQQLHGSVVSSLPGSLSAAPLPHSQSQSQSSESARWPRGREGAVAPHQPGSTSSSHNARLALPPDHTHHSTSEEPVQPKSPTLLDPITFHAISRKTSQAEALQLANIRADRGRKLDLEERLRERAPTKASGSSGNDSKADAHTYSVQSQQRELTDDPERAKKLGPPKDQSAGDRRPPDDEASKSASDTEQKYASVGLGQPPGDPRAAGGEEKMSRRKTLLGRLGLSASARKASRSASKSLNLRSKSASTPPALPSKEEPAPLPPPLPPTSITVREPNTSASPSSLSTHKTASQTQLPAVEGSAAVSLSTRSRSSTLASVAENGSRVASNTARSRAPSHEGAVLQPNGLPVMPAKADYQDNPAHLRSKDATTGKTKYLKTKLKNKSKREFHHLFLAQELNCITTPSPSLASPLSATLSPSATAITSVLLSPTSSLNAPPQYATIPTSARSDSYASSARIPNTPRVVKKAISHSKATWCLKFSHDGNYLASAGQDGVIRVWQVISTPAAREATLQTYRGENGSSGHSGVAGDAASIKSNNDVGAAAPTSSSPEKSSESDKRNKRMSVSSVASSHTGSPSPANPSDTAQLSASNTGPPLAPVFESRPVHEWRGHTSDVLDLSWSKNNFLLSSSMDKTVRLWHITRRECLCAFQHPDFVTSIAFHPRDDRYFLSGSLDAKLRLWSIPDKKVHCWTQLPELITCVSFTSEGELAIAGTFVGICFFFDIHDLALVTKLASKSTRGKNAKGRKITSVVPIPKGEPSEPERLLVTSNDSRMRLWNVTHVLASHRARSAKTPTGLISVSSGGVPKIVAEKHLEAKYRNHENTSSQIKGTFSDDGRWIISGSEDRQCYIWQSGLLDFPTPFAKTSKKAADKSPGSESFAPAISCSPASQVTPSPAVAGTTDGGGAVTQPVVPPLSGGIVTCAIFAPASARASLARSGDPLYNEWLEEIADENEEEEEEVQDEADGGLQRSISMSSVGSSSNNHVHFGSSASATTTRSDQASVHSATTSSAYGSIVITADDQSGIIRVYRNHLVPTPTKSKKVTEERCMTGRGIFSGRRASKTAAAAAVAAAATRNSEVWTPRQAALSRNDKGAAADDLEELA